MYIDTILTIFHRKIKWYICGSLIRSLSLDGFVNSTMNWTVSPDTRNKYTKKQIGWINKLFSPGFKKMKHVGKIHRSVSTVKNKLCFYCTLRRFQLNFCWSTSPNLLLLQQLSCLDRGWPFATLLDLFSIWKFRFQNAMAYMERTENDEAIKNRVVQFQSSKNTI